MPTSQGRYWMLTIPVTTGGWEPNSLESGLPDGVHYIKGQEEEGAETGYRHYQVVVYFRRKVRIRAVKSVFGEGVHCEPTRSDAAREYVWKEDTRVAGTQFEYGSLAIRRANDVDFESVRRLSMQGRLLEIPADLFIRYYANLRRIAADYAVPEHVEKRVHVFVGPTGTGKSRRAWEEAGVDAYPKGPTSKFWCGYQGQKKVVIDEFRGGIDVSHILRWLDRYPVLVEIKGSSSTLKCDEIWITSNLEPRYWYPTLDTETLDALLRRMEVTIFE